MRHLGTDPVAAEDASIDPAIRTLEFFHGFGDSDARDAPAPPPCLAATDFTTGHAHTTTISPERARTLTRMMRARTIALRLHALRQCRKGHPMTPENIYHGKHGNQCRTCRNAAQRSA